MPRSEWTIDTSHSTIAFSVRHMVIARARGTFGDWKGTASYDDDDALPSGLEVRIRVEGIDTKDAQRDDHLRSADFFDAASHPDIVFVATRMDRRGAASLRVTGDLTIRGTTRPVDLRVKYLGQRVDPAGVVRRAYSARTTLDRTRWGLTWNAALEAGGFLVGEKVDVEMDVQMVPAPAG